jgi:hypothetical protein
LLAAGFNILCYVGGGHYLEYTPEAVIMDRWHIDGVALLLQGDRFRKFFDAKEVTDQVRPPLSLPPAPQKTIARITGELPVPEQIPLPPAVPENNNTSL